MRLQNPFAAVSTTGLDSVVLTVLARSDQYLTVNQIHGLLPEEGSLQGVRNALTRFVEQGVVLERATGRSVAYTFNREHLVAESIVQIANAKAKFLSRMALAISEWDDPPLTAKLFGSAARNEMSTKSDIDILFVFRDEAAEEAVDEEVRRLAARATLWTGNDVRPLVYRSSEVRPASIFTAILEEGIDIAGEPTWLRRHLRAEPARV